MIFQLPKRKTSSFAFYGKEFVGLHSFSRLNLNSHNTFINYLISLCLLVFTVGFISSVALLHPYFVDYDFYYFIKDINLPEIQTKETIKNHRLVFYISVDELGNISTLNHGVSLSKVELEYLFTRMKTELPPFIVGLFVDEKCKMGNILDLISIIRESKCQQILFYSKKLLSARITSLISKESIL